MFVFMAGASTTWPVNARYVVVRKSSASPCANFASRSAVAGATTRIWFSCAMRMCSIALESVSSELAAENRLVIAFFPVRAANVSGRTNSSAAAVIST